MRWPGGRIRFYPGRIAGTRFGQGLLVVAACASVLASVSQAAATPAKLSWAGAGPVRLGQPLAPGSVAPGITVECGPGTKVSDIHTSARGARGPDGVRVGMTDRALRAALGRGSVAFKSRGRPGRLRVGPGGHTVWALDTSTRSHAVVQIGVAIAKRIALRAAQSKSCTAPPLTTPTAPAQSTSPAAPSDAPAPPSSDTSTTTTTTTTTTPPQCPATLPKVGPYMRVACDDSTGNEVQYTCHPDWRDTNQDPADGCEAEKDGLQTMWFTQDSSQALADHILGSFQTGGYGYSTATNGPAAEDWGQYDGSISPIVVSVPASCGSDPSVDCAGGQPANPAPTMNIDLTQHPGDTARSFVTMTGATSSTGFPFFGAGAGTTQATAGARFRLATNAPIQYAHSGATCNISIDSTQGTVPDVTLEATLSRATDPDTGQGEDGPPQFGNVTVSNLQSSDITISPAGSGDFACYGSAFITAQNVADAIAPALSGWFKPATRLCGAAGPFWWQTCPPSVNVGW